LPSRKKAIPAKTGQVEAVDGAASVDRVVKRLT
jgi:hypothetical protein